LQIKKFFGNKIENREIVAARSGCARVNPRERERAPFGGGLFETIGFAVLRAFGKFNEVENLENRSGHYGGSEKRKGLSRNAR